MLPAWVVEEKLRRRVAELEAALKPFAALPFDQLYQGKKHPEVNVFAINGVGITGHDILAARAVLEHKAS